MNKITAVLLSLCLMCSASLAIAADAMDRPDAMDKGAMSKDAMKKDAMKKEGMAKEGMAKDAMKKDDGMK